MNDLWPRPTQGPAKTIETDYLVIGAGAMGMAFTDTLITESGARVVMIDRACQPGGHWTTAYPFVRLHQPSAYYGVNSRALGNNTIDLVGWNQGLNELAPVGEICAYFDAVLQQQLLPTGRVDYFPMSEYLGDGRFRHWQAPNTSSPSIGASSMPPTCVPSYSRCGRRRTRLHPASTASLQTNCPNSAPGIATWSSVPARPAWTSAYGCSETTSALTS